jgi:hypothetical protein
MLALMPLILVIVLVVVLAIVLGGIWFAVKELNEFEDIFHYGVMGILLLIIGAAVYLAFATPSLATYDHKTSTPGKVTEQESNLILE